MKKAERLKKLYLMRATIVNMLESVSRYENTSYSQWIEQAIIEKLRRDYGATLEELLKSWEADILTVEAAHTLISGGPHGGLLGEVIAKVRRPRDRKDTRAVG